MPAQPDRERYMRRALRLARRALGQTSPNPMVGAVIVRAGRVVGEGYHRRAGAQHAEVEALRQAGSSARGATLYVTLEPCHHTGRTPPCCDAVLAAGIARVVIAVIDPNLLTHGRGVARLRRAGIPVTIGVLANEARRLNEPFFKAMTVGLPWILAKTAESLDGKIATASGESRWITSEPARRWAHRWRSRVDAILVGINTVLRDDPFLTARIGTPRHGCPLKVIVDSRLRTPPMARCLSAGSPAPSLIATTRPARQRMAALRRRGAEIVIFPPRHDGRVPLRKLARLLARRGVQSVLLEGGGELFASALAERLVDRAAFLIAPRLIGGRASPTAVGGSGVRRLASAVRLEEVTVRRLGPDFCVEGRVVYPDR